MPWIDLISMKSDLVASDGLCVAQGADRQAFDRSQARRSDLDGYDLDQGRKDLWHSQRWNRERGTAFRVFGSDDGHFASELCDRLRKAQIECPGSAFGSKQDSAKSLVHYLDVPMPEIARGRGKSRMLGGFIPQHRPFGGRK